MAGDGNFDYGEDEDVGLQERDKLKTPDMYRVILHNDHYTTQEFVINVLISVFNKSAAEATRLMLDVHRTGRGIVGTYAYDVAATKAAQVRHMAKAEQYPLKCTVEPA